MPARAHKPISPDGFYKEVEHILVECVGAENAIGRGRILQLVRTLPLYRKATDRHLRAAIEEMRSNGLLICNLANGDGYFLARTADEWQAFKALYFSQVSTMLERFHKMERAAEDQWGAGALQARLL